ncbi:RNB domain-containing ribonuclease, partial [Bacillus sp. WP8]|uniref:RNB domain-containing ribonuclease n=1 Tax=Bacillus sp. WP8 TaxID=756828 RepID=UPI0011A9F9FE
DGNGKVAKDDILESVMKRRERMRYWDVNKILVEEEEELVKKYEAVVGMLEEMEKVGEIVGEKGMEGGGVEFDLKEGKVVVDDEGGGKDVVI